VHDVESKIFGLFINKRKFLVENILQNRMDMHWVLIYVKDVVVNVLRIFFDHQLEDRFVELNKINLSERLNREHRDLLDHIEMLLKKKENSGIGLL
jgi:hypothetical protein